MDVKIVGSVPVKGYLLKFIHRQENLQPGQALNLNSHGLTGTLLQNLLSEKIRVNHEDRNTKEALDYDAQLRFKVSTRMQRYARFYISRKSITLFNRIIGRYFHELLYDRIRYGIRRGAKEKDIIYNFIKEFDIEEDISFEALKKANYRLRKNKKIDGIHQQKCKTAI